MVSTTLDCVPQAGFAGRSYNHGTTEIWVILRRVTYQKVVNIQYPFDWKSDYACVSGFQLAGAIRRQFWISRGADFK